MAKEEIFFDILFSQEQIEARCKELGKQISEHYKDEPIVAVGILRGCYLFYSDLLKHIKSPALIDYMYVSSYGDEKTSSGRVKIERDLQTDITDKHILLIDDIIDSGLTLANLVELLKVRKPKSISIATMLNKKCCRKIDIEVAFSGFDVDNHFLVGYGLDYKQYYRNMNFIGKLKTGMETELEQYVNSLRKS
jgi:hypoxanthine phosphoribosyltransferase